MGSPPAASIHAAIDRFAVDLRVRVDDGFAGECRIETHTPDPTRRGPRSSP